MGLKSLILNCPAMNHHSKIIPKKGLRKILASLKKQGKKIVTYNGSFDLLHRGHVMAINHAKSLGDVLIILLNSDRSVRLYKGPHRPFVSEEDRAYLLSSLASVDYIVVFNQINPKKILEEIKPDIHCAGGNWGKGCIGRDIVEKNGGKIAVLPFRDGHSTTTLTKSVVANSVREKTAIFLIFNVLAGIAGWPSRNLHLDPRAVRAVREFSGCGSKVIVLIDPSTGIKKTKVTDFRRQATVAIKKARLKIDRICSCPHKASHKCSCRKSGTGLILAMAKRYGLNLSNSWLIGNQERDIIAGREVNVKTIKIGQPMSRKVRLEPNLYAEDLQAALRYITKA